MDENLQLDLEKIKIFFENKRYVVKSLKQPWRHVVGQLEKDGELFFLKLAANEKIGERTKNEAAWNWAVEKGVIKLIPPFDCPRVIGDGYIGRNYWFISNFISGELIANPDRVIQTSDLEKHLDDIVRMQVSLIQQFPKIRLPKDEEDKKKDLAKDLVKKVQEWSDKTKYNVTRLKNLAIKRTVNWQTAPCHGDFVPWHIIKDSKKLFLIDSEAGRIKGVKFYDVAYFYHRVYTKLKRPDVANLFWKKFKNQYELNKNDLGCWEMILAQRLIGGFLDAENDQVTSMELQKKLEGELLAGKLVQ